MQMASRIERSWQELGRQLAGARPGSVDWMSGLRDWLWRSPAGVSRIAAERLGTAKGIQLVVQAEAAELPISTSAITAFLSALRASPPSDPQKYVEHVDALCWRLAVFQREDDSCPVCQSDLELWTDGRATFEICILLGCCIAANGTQVPPPAGLRPATRDEVLARYPSAPLLPRA
jgi:hypothetical protein